jgi:hypothetical protein
VTDQHLVQISELVTDQHLVQTSELVTGQHLVQAKDLLVVVRETVPPVADREIVPQVADREIVPQGPVLRDRVTNRQPANPLLQEQQNRELRTNVRKRKKNGINSPNWKRERAKKLLSFRNLWKRRQSRKSISQSRSR